MTIAYSYERKSELSTADVAEIELHASQQESLYTEIPIEGAMVHSKPVEGTLYLPHKAEEDVGKIYIPGFMEFEKATAPLAIEMAQRGLIMVTMKPLRAQPNESKLSWEHFKNPWILQQQVIHALMKTVAQQRGIDRYDLIGHSMGNAEALGAAYHETVTLDNKDIYIRSVVADAGIGLDGNNMKTKPMKRLVAIAKNDIAKSVPKLMQLRGEGFNEDAKHHILADPLRIAREGLRCIARSHAHEHIEQLRAKGVKVGAVVGEYDNFFRPWAVRLASEDKLDHMWEIPEADHLHANAYPAEHAGFLKSALRELNDDASKSVRAIR